MTTVGDVLARVEALAPSYMKEEWDNVGLLCGRRDKAVKKILVALDPFETVVQEAIDVGADLLLTHHPLIFGGISAVNEDTETGRSLLALIRHDIAAINAHTNLDQAPGGINDVLAERLGLQNMEVIEPKGTDAQGRPWGLLHKGEVPEQSLPDFLPMTKSALDCEGLRFVDGGRPVRHVAVGGGACGSEFAQAAEAGCDTFVTADVKYNQFWDAKVLGLNLIDAGHFKTENPGILAFGQALDLPDVEVVYSQVHGDCIHFF